MSDLKPCPFCGGTELGSGGDDKVVGFWCRNCQAQGPNHYGLVEWNTRADPTIKAADELAEAVRDVAYDMIKGEVRRDELEAALAAYRKAVGDE